MPKKKFSFATINCIRSKQPKKSFFFQSAATNIQSIYNQFQIFIPARFKYPATLSYDFKRFRKTIRKQFGQFIYTVICVQKIRSPLRCKIIQFFCIELGCMKLIIQSSFVKKMCAASFGGDSGVPNDRVCGPSCYRQVIGRKISGG